MAPGACGAQRNKCGAVFVAVSRPIPLWLAMTVPLQKDLLTKRWRRVRAPAPSEFQIHASIVAYLRQMARPEVQYWHCANGEVRDARTGAKLKAMGLKPGVPDLMFRWRARWSMDCLQETLDMEIKPPGRKQSEAQKAWEARTVAVGGHYYVVRSLDEAIGLFEKHGITRPRQSAGRP